MDLKTAIAFLFTELHLMFSLMDKVPSGIEPMLKDLEEHIMSAGLADMVASAETITSVSPLRWRLDWIDLYWSQDGKVHCPGTQKRYKNRNKINSNYKYFTAVKHKSIYVKQRTRADVQKEAEAGFSKRCKPYVQPYYFPLN